MINEMRKDNLYEETSNVTYDVTRINEDELEYIIVFSNLTSLINNLERVIQDANFECTNMKIVRICIFIFIAILAIVLLGIYFIKRKTKGE